MNILNYIDGLRDKFIRETGKSPKELFVSDDCQRQIILEIESNKYYGFKPTEAYNLKVIILPTSKNTLFLL